MKRFNLTFKSLIIGSIFALAGISVSAQVKVDYNALPDYGKKLPVMNELAIPNGNAKFAKKSTSQATSGAKSNRYVTASDEGDVLPDHWNNALFKHFPPIFNQSGPSCMGSSFTGYIFTHELNSYRNLDGSSPNNQMAVFFGWLQTYMNSSKEDIEMYNGCPSAATYGGRTNSAEIGYYDWRTREAGWMQGYNKWYSAMFNRAQGFYEFPTNVGSKAGREAVKRWIYNHNGDTDFHSGGLCYVTLAASSIYGTIQDTPANREAGVVGKRYISEWNEEINHAQTLVGWDDRVEFDLNGNGIYGEESANEVGAWIICNSWGTGWGNGGFAYVPYRRGGPIKYVDGNLYWNPYITYIKKDYVPQRTLKVLMDYSHRSELYLKVGVNSDTSAARPAFTLPMTSFKNAGDGAENRAGAAPATPMLGRYVDGMHYEPMEFGYDVTNLSNACDPTKPVKYFFIVDRNGVAGSGHVYKASIMDYIYESEGGVEIPFKIDTVALGKDTPASIYLSVVVPGETLNPPVNAEIVNNKLVWYNPTATSLKLKKYYIYKNNQLCDSVSANIKTYPIDDLAGNYSVSAIYAYKKKLVESAKSNIARLQTQMPEGNNVSFVGTNATMIVPNALTNKLQDATIEFMIKPSELQGSLYHIGGSKNSDFFIEITASGQLRAGWDSDNSVSSAAKSIKAGTWYHVAIVIQHNVMTLYLNGLKKASLTSNTRTGLPELGDLLIGAYDGKINGELDELRVWSKARLLAEIYSSKDYQITDPSSQGNLAVYLPMNTITEGGETKYQEFACGNHAYLSEGEGESQENTSILNGNSFKYSPSINIEDSVYATLPCQMAGVGAVTIKSWSWDMPGATPRTSTLQSPYVTYDEPGTYTVTLTTVGADDTETTTTKEINVISGSMPEPNFDISTPTQATAQPVSFINRTQGVNCHYTWDIESLGTMYQTNASATFNAPGTYNITLTATNSAGSASVTKTVDIYKARPVSKFNIAPNVIIKGETTYLEDKSTGDPTSWIWTLGNGKRYLQVDGQFSSLVPPAPGYYNVTLQTSNSEGSNIASQSRALCVMNADAKNGLNFYGKGEQLELDRPFAANQRTFTVEWWMNPGQYEGSGAFTLGNFTTDASNLDEFYITYNGHQFKTYSYVKLNEWHHYAITFNSGTISLYRDGVLFTTFNGTSYYTVPSWADKFVFGRTDHSMRGNIDELRIWDLALTKLQIQNFCNQPIEEPSKYSALKVYYDFNQSGGDVIDRTSNGLDAKRLNFGPDGDAWIVSPGVFTLDFDGDLVSTDVSDKYLTNYKAPFLYTENKVNPTYRSSAYELEMGTDKSTWVFKSPVQVSEDITRTVFVDASRSYQLYASPAYNFGVVYNQRLYQTVSLPQGHYKFSISSGNYYYPENSRLVVCFGDSIVDNNNLDLAVAHCYVRNSTELEFDVLEDGTSVSLGVIYNLPESSYNAFGIKQFYLTQYTSTTQVADGVSSAYDAVNKGLLGTFSGEVGALRVVSDDIIDVKIYNTQGQCVYNEYMSGSKRIALPAGIYIANGQKVIVR